jgi:hypothetical protein
MPARRKRATTTGAPRSRSTTAVLRLLSAMTTRTRARRKRATTTGVPRSRSTTAALLTRSAQMAGAARTTSASVRTRVARDAAGPSQTLAVGSETAGWVAQGSRSVRVRCVSIRPPRSRDTPWKVVRLGSEREADRRAGCWVLWHEARGRTLGPLRIGRSHASRKSPNATIYRTRKGTSVSLDRRRPRRALELPPTNWSCAATSGPA